MPAQDTLGINIARGCEPTSFAYSLLLAEAGALMQTMYLVATAMELAPCALGACDARLVQKLLGSRDGEEVAVGEFLIGSRDRV